MPGNIDNREEKGRQGAVNGFAHEHIAVGILMKKYKHVSLVDFPLEKYDVIIVLKEGDEKNNFIRAQIKTVSENSIKFTGGGRGGVDREYKSGVKEYTQSTVTSDVVIGVKPKDTGLIELYFVPTVLIEQINQKSISIGKVAALKDNYEILENCKNRDLILSMCKEILTKCKKL